MTPALCLLVSQKEIGLVFLQEMDQELERYHKANATLDLNISDLRYVLTSLAGVPYRQHEQNKIAHFL